MYNGESTVCENILLRNNVDHNHGDGRRLRSETISPEIYARIKKLVLLGKRKRFISHAVRYDDRFVVKPSEIQVFSFSY